MTELEALQKGAEEKVPQLKALARMPLLKNCGVCDGAKLHYLFSIQGNRVVCCDDCGLLMLNPQPSAEQLGKIYQVSGEKARHRARERKTPAALHCLDLLKKYRGEKPGKLLEIGCGEGDFLIAAAERGFDVAGIEYSSAACDLARKKVGVNGTVILGRVDAVKEAAASYDVCVLADVVEHVRDPRAFLASVHHLLKPGGVLLLTTPSPKARSVHLKKNRWPEFKPGRLYYFNESTLQSLLFRSGFRDMIVPSDVANGMVLLARPYKQEERKKLSVIVPAFNESATIREVLDSLLLKELENLDKEIIVVESNSTDGTKEIVSSYKHHPRIKLVFEERPRGKGHAIRTGLAHATGDFILIQDADLEYDFEDYDVLLEPLMAGRAAFVLGSRHGGRILKLRKFRGDALAALIMNLGHWFFCALVDVLYWLPLRDPFTMFKVFRRDCLYGLTFECNRFDFDYELLIKLVRKGFTPIEIPVNYKSRSFEEGKKVSMLRDPWTWLKAILKYRFVRIDPLEQVAATAENSPPA